MSVAVVVVVVVVVVVEVVIAENKIIQLLCISLNIFELKILTA